MVAAYHLIWTAYGCWLPNDPRGSSSHNLRHDKFAPLGDVHLGRKEIQPPSRVLRSFYQQADDLLEHERLLFTEEEILLVGASFRQTIRQHGYTCFECAIMPDHVHVLIRRHSDKAEQIVDHLQRESKNAFLDAGCRPVNHPVWAGPGWKVFLNTRKEIERCIQYIRENPLKAGGPLQHWDFVKAYGGWMPLPNLKF